MKKRLLSFVIAICTFSSFAQSPIVFCPPGAEWHYNFGSGFSPTIYNFSIKYAGDSIINSQTCKILKYNRFFLFCDMLSPKITLIRQNGDTVFMRNAATQHKWQILFNFAAQVGQSWMDSLEGGSNISYHKYTVDSIKYVLVNSFNLRQLFVKHIYYPNSLNTAGGTGNVVITERLGTNAYLFYYDHNYSPTCEDYVYSTFLCYQDSSFGVKQFTAKACQYNYNVGIQNYALREGNIKFYPNPIKDKFTLDLEAENLSDFNYNITNTLGQCLYSGEKLNKHQEIDISSLPPGLYFIKVQNKSGQQVFEIIKE